jgi:hypothetical protein
MQGWWRCEEAFGMQDSTNRGAGNGISLTIASNSNLASNTGKKLFSLDEIINLSLELT